MKYLFLLASVIWVCLFISFYEKPVDTSSTISQNELGLFEKTIESRGNDIKWNDCLHNLAIERSKDMFERNYFSHEDPSTGSIETWEKIVDSCGDYQVVGENLVKDFRDYSQAHTALMGSELHRKNIMDERFVEMGVGCYENICTELFGNFIK